MDNARNIVCSDNSLSIEINREANHEEILWQEFEGENNSIQVQSFKRLAGAHLCEIDLLFSNPLGQDIKGKIVTSKQTLGESEKLEAKVSGIDEEVVTLSCDTP